MKRKFIILPLLFSLIFCCCKTATETSNNEPASVREVLLVLDTADIQFYNFAQQNLSATPGEILMQTKKRLDSLSTVSQISAFDSLNLDIELKSGLHAIYSLFVADSSGLSSTRGGESRHAELLSTPKSKNTITNKKVLIFAPFVGGGPADLYHDGELNTLADVFKNSGQNFDVTITDGSVSDVNSFGQYGLVIIDTHGLPIGFYTGKKVVGLSTLYDTNEAEIKYNINAQLGVDAYDYVKNGSFYFSFTRSLPRLIGWQEFLQKPVNAAASYYQIVISSHYINGLFPMPNTIIVGNFCYSGWTKTGKAYLLGGGSVNVTEPIQTAFTNKQLISYYSYGYPDGTSAPVDNNFAKQMENVLANSFVNDGDSTGNAYLDPGGGQYFQGGSKLPMYFNQFGPTDYSYGKCNTDVLVDERDGQRYNVFCFKDKTWMAQNLNYATPESRCYKDDAANCVIYGRLYSWKEAMNGEAPSDKYPSGVRGICPKGWHIPSMSEYNELIAFNGQLQNSGTHLRDTMLWKNESSPADNTSGFSALPGGILSADSTFSQLGYYGYFLSSTAASQPSGASQIQVVYFGNAAPTQVLQSNDKASCRCVKDP